MAAAQIPFGLPLTLLDLSVNWCYKKGDGQQWVRICLPVNAQSTMKPWIIVLTVSAHGILVFLHVLGSLKDDLEEIDQCWVQPPTRFCGKRCTKVRKCVSPNYTCCWTYCGNICLNNEEPFETLMKV
ncbi:protein WFDC9 isoform X1 [Mus musculus]|nr:protein WFDC9 isoform X1 [Mus musculus]|eukprot:XP_006500047.3 PREDICTED: protein WFDC9 isoform X2 [Mus musculus]